MLTKILFLVFAAGTIAAQTQSAFECNGAGAVPPTVRAEGVSELTGDLVLNCTGGVPSQAFGTVPQVNIQIFVNANITSRLLNDPFSEALLLIDEPSEPNQRVCSPGPCPITGAGPLGINYAAPGPSTIPNVFQGRQTGPNSVTFFGVPVDPPGARGSRVIRITNIRVNAAQLGVSQTLVPAQLLMFISISGSTSVPVSNPQQTVGFVQPGLNVRVLGVDGSNNTLTVPDTLGAQLAQCAFSGRMVVRFQEGFASAFKVRAKAAVGTPYDTESSPAPVAQDAPGVDFFKETGFYNPAFPAANGLNRAGLADAGTRLMVRFSNIPSGVSLSVDLYERNVIPSRARLVTTDSNGAGPFAAATSDLTSLTVTNGTAMAVWEVLSADPFAIETFDFNVYISYSGVSTTTTAQVAASFAPISQTPMASGSAPIPRFVSGTPRPAFTLSPCLFSLLFPFVSNGSGYDTGIAISNTSTDPFATNPTAGACTINYYGNSAPPPQVTQPIPSGSQLMWTLSGGGNFGVAATPGFQGYVIARCAFPFVHGFAYITGAPVLPAMTSTGYLGIVLDAPLFARTQQSGEAQAH